MKHVVLAGDTNAGKSSLFNALLDQPRAIVSEIPGTTTDPVTKAMELLPYGPITLVDTAGANDSSALGEARGKKTMRWLDMADMVLYVIDPAGFDEARFEAATAAFHERRQPYFVVVTKSDLHPAENAPLREALQRRSPGGRPLDDGRIFFVSAYDNEAVGKLRTAIAQVLMKETPEDRSLTDALIPFGGVAVMVVPLDSGAPAGRLILPQVQFIRSCLDNGIRCHVTSVGQLPDALTELKRVDYVVTDSQAFAEVDKLTPKEIPLTSFSILSARQKGNFGSLLSGSRYIRALKENDRVLIAESCTHNTSHEDIGRAKLPKVLEKISGVTLAIDFSAGKEFPDVLSDYKLVVHCGGCMLTARAFAVRQEAAARQGVPFTNYGMALAMGSHTLERSVSGLT